MEIHPSARKHGIADEDSEHAVENAMAMTTKPKKPGSTSGPPATLTCSKWSPVARGDTSELAIHAMKMRPKYERLLEGG